MFLDPIYMLIFAVGLVLSLIASARVKSAFARGREVPIKRGLNGAAIAEAILRHFDISDVTVVEHPGFLSDHYNPMTKTLALSPDVYHGRHASAAGVAAHEVGHAIQHAQGYFPLWIRSFLVPAANIGSNLGPWLVIIGLIMAGSAGMTPVEAGGWSEWLAIGGVILFGAAVAFTLVTLPVEFDATSRAKLALADMGLVQHGEEAIAVRKVLSAAGMTYVAAAVVALLNLLYWAWRAGLIGGRRD